MMSAAVLFGSFFRTCWKTQRRYLLSVYISVFGVILAPVLYLVVWRQVALGAESGAHGYSASEFVSYYVLLMVVNHIGFTWFFFEMDDRIRKGKLSPLLLRPVHPIHNDIADNVAFKIITSPAIVLAIVVFIAAFGVTMTSDKFGLAFFAVSVVIATALRFSLEWTAALAALWTTRIDAVGRIYGFVAHFLGGAVAPLAVLPGPLRTAAAWTPFPWMLAFPVDVAMGRHSHASAAGGVAIQLAWLGVCIAALNVVWRRAVRKYTAVGG